MSPRRPLLVVGLCLAAMTPTAASALSGRQILNKLRQVAGAGSGLDADTVRGVTPDQIVSQATGAVAGAVAQVLASGYVRTAAASVSPGFCRCLDLGCNTTADLLVDCGGDVVSDGTGYLTEVTRLTDGVTCRTCGCTTGSLSTGLAVATFCLRP